MILVADSGSTKTAWGVVGTDIRLTTEGLNPHFASNDRVLAACGRVREVLPDGKPTVVFYGAGCGDPRQKRRMAALLGRAFGTGRVTVYSDLLGACRALWGHEPGLVAILGTGSNACFFDGTAPAAKTFSAGFILGDHGSGNHLGRLLLTDYLAGIMPKHVARLFAESCPLKPAEITDRLYFGPHPNRFLAQVGRFAVDHIDEGYCRGKVNDALHQWFHYQLRPIKGSTNCRQLRAVGGLAAAVELPLRMVLGHHGINLDAVVASPLEDLLRYHER